VNELSEGRGVGSALIEEGLRIAKEKKFHTIIARIAGGNEASIKYHEKYGFRLVGVMKEVGRKFDKWIDVSILQWMNPNN
jgi:L-amino acid N-acyltransferase YncA